MATRAFLLCGDEKAVQAVTQILDELEVSFEHSSEPGFSLKRLATQRFDLLIVDCDNAQNATQVFNSARASNLNKTSIAIAIVEGKAGVPNAFRLGASLVLTKPVSLEQARNTLRTGVGMTRKDAQEVKPAAPAVTSPAAPSQTISTPTIAAPVVPQPPAPTIVAPRPTATPAVLTPVAPPVPTATKPVAEGTKLAIAPPPADKPAASRPPMVPFMPPQEHKPALTNFTESPTPAVSPVPAAPKVVATAATSATSTPTTSSPATKNFDSVFKMPAAESAKPKTADVKAESKVESAKSAPALSIVDPLAEEDVLDPVKDHGVPSFGALGKDSFAGLDSDSPRKGKGWLIAAVVVLFVGAGVFGAWATQPEFKKFVAWEYLNTMSKISALRGQPQVVAQKPEAPAPVQDPVTAPTVATTPDPSAANLPADPSAIPGPSTTTSAGAGPNAQPGTDSSTAASVSDRTATKGATVQPAKQDIGASHTASSATLVPTSLPATPVAKAPSGELLEVPEDFADDQIVRRVHPTYPKQARARKLQGTVVLEAIVSKKGSVDSLQLVSGDSVLAQAAADAVKQWKYKPYFHNGEPTEFQTKITIDFKLP
jgi:TonB family protein